MEQEGSHMKITIAYLPEEYKAARGIRAFAIGYLPGARIKDIYRQTPYMHTYITTKKPEKIEESEASD